MSWAQHVKVAAGRFTVTSGTGNQSVTGVGFQPKAYILIYTKNASDDADSTGTGSILSVGMTDGTRQVCVASGSEDNQSYSDTGRRGFTDAVLATHDAQGSQTVEGEAGHVSMDSDGFTINKSVAFTAPESPYVHYIAFAGDTLSAYAGTVGLNDTQNASVDVTSPGFEPDVVITAFIGPLIDASDSVFNDLHSFSLGWAVNPDRRASANQYSMLVASDESQNFTQTVSRFDSNYAGTSYSSGAMNTSFEINSFDASGFSVTTRLNGAIITKTVGYLALYLGTDAEVYSVARTARTSTGDDTESSAGFQPIFLLGIGSAVVTSANTLTDGGSMAIGITDGTHTYAIEQFDQDNADTSHTHCRVTNTQFMSANSHSGSIDWEATFSSFSTSGWTINYGDAAASAYQNAFLAIGDSTETVDLANHAAGQETDKLGGDSSVTGKELFAFKLTNNSASTVTVDQVVLSLSSVTGIAQGDFANLTIYVDSDNDGVKDAGETTSVGGAGAVDAGVTAITFSTDFTIAAGATVNCILTGDLSSLAANDTVTIGLGTSGITLTSGTVGGSSATNAVHTADYTVLLANHSAGQETDALGACSATAAELFAFRLTNNTASTVTVDQAVLSLSSVTGIVQGDFASLAIYVDSDNDGVKDAGETTAVGGSGVVDAGVSTMTFSTDFTIAAGATVNYLLTGNVSNLNGGDTVTLALTAGNVTLTAGSTGGSSPANVTHTGDYSMTVADHAAGQEDEKFRWSSSVAAAELFAFRLTNNTTSTVTVDQIVFPLSSVTGIVHTDFASLALYVDDDGDGSKETGETTTAGGSGVVNGGVSSITFSTDITVSASATVNYILVGNVSNLVENDSVTIGLGGGNLTLTCGSATGSAANCTHTQCGDGYFKYLRSITIDADLVGTDNTGTLPSTGFPVLVKLSGDWLKTLSVDPVNGRICNSNGYDIMFRTGTVTLAYEIEKYDGTNGELVAWVRLDSLSKATDTTFYIYYGNKCINAPTETPTSVWDSNYEAVWHLKESGNGTASEFQDSTSNSVDGQGGGGASGDVPIQVTTGKIGNAQEFDGTDDWIKLPGNLSILRNVGYATVSGWFRADAMAAEAGIVNISINNSGAPTVNSRACILHQPANTLAGGGRSADSDTFQYHLTTSSFATGTWHYVVTAIDYAADSVLIYVDGSLQSVTRTIAFSQSTTSNTTATVSALGSQDDGGSGYFNGILDELRVSKTVRDADWNVTEYNNQNNPGDVGSPGFCTVGSEEYEGPSVVDLVSFAATGRGDFVEVAWETAQEIDNAGFDLFRGMEIAGPFNKLNGALIPALTFGVSGSYYVFDDPNVAPGVLYYYKLEDVDLHGERTAHGPVCVDWDGDGMPGDWEIAHGLDPAVDDAGLDPDGDGLVNYEEYAQGTDPLVPNTTPGDGAQPPVAYWPMDGCAAANQAVASGDSDLAERSSRDGAVLGSVLCVPDRFGNANAAFQFTGAGSIAAGNLPVIEGDFCLQLWVCPASPAQGEADRQVFLEIHHAGDPYGGLSRRLVWERALSALAAERGDEGVSLRIAGVAPDCWHHVLLSRSAETLAFYLDGDLAGRAGGDTAPLGDELRLGSDVDGAAPFHGKLDDVSYESRPCEAASLPAMLVRGGPSVYLYRRGFSEVREVAVNLAVPEEFEALRLRVLAGALSEGGGFLFEGAEVRAVDVLPEGTPATGGVFALLGEGRLFAIDAGGAEAEVGRLQKVGVDLDAQEAMYRAILNEPLVLPAEAETVLSVRFQRPAVSETHRARFGVRRPESLTITPGVFIAGQRLVEGMAAEGDTLVITPHPAPPVRLAPSPPAAAAQPETASSAKELLSFTLEAVDPSVVTEPIEVRTIICRSAAERGATLQSLKDARLLDRDGTTLSSGTVVPETGEIRFELGEDPMQVNPAEGFGFLVVADFDGYEVKDASEGALVPVRSTAWHPSGWSAALAAILVLLAQRARRSRSPVAGKPRSRSRLVSAGLLFCLCALGLIAAGLLDGCARNGDGSGGGPTASFVQVVLADERDFVAAGKESGNPVTVEDFPEGGITGPRYTISTSADAPTWNGR